MIAFDGTPGIKAEFAQIMGALQAAKVKGSASGKNWSVSAREGSSARSA